MRTQCFLCIGMFIVAGCATEPASVGRTGQQSGGASQSDVTMGFIASVVDGCIPAVEVGTSVNEVSDADRVGSGPATKFSTVTDADARAMVAANSEDVVWTPEEGQGVVFVKSSPGDCSVSAYGAPVDLAYQAIAAVLTTKRGYEELDLPGSPPEGRVVRAFTKAVGEREILVSLSGSEPGTPGTLSRFSSLVAGVTSK